MVGSLRPNRNYLDVSRLNKTKTMLVISRRIWYHVIRGWGITDLQGRKQIMKIVFFEDGSVMTASRQCVLRRAIARKMSYEPMRYWFRACDEWVKAYKRYQLIY